MNSENLQPPWKPGESGNPKGRPPGKSFKDVLAYLLDRKVGKELQTDVDVAFEAEYGRPMTHRESTAWQQVVKANAGDTRAFMALADRAEGKPAQPIESSGNVTLVVSEKFRPKKPEGDDG